METGESLNAVTVHREGAKHAKTHQETIHSLRCSLCVLAFFASWWFMKRPCDERFCPDLGKRKRITKMEKTLYLHIGYPKTGTSAIQEFLDSNDKQLSERGVHYINILRCVNGSHNPLAYILYYKYHNTHLFMDHQWFIAAKDEYFKQLNDEIANIFTPVILMSSENFIYLNPEAIDEMIGFFQSNFPNIKTKVILYIRDFQQQVLSEAKFIVQLKHSNTNDERISNFSNTLTSIHHNLLAGINIFATRTGKDNLVFRRYGKQYFKGGSIFSDFLDIFGIELTNEFVLPQGLVNESLTCCETVYFKDILNRMTLKTSEEMIVMHLLAWEKSNRGTKFSLPADIAARVKELAGSFHRHLLDNYLDDSYADFFQSSSLSQNQPDYTLTPDTFFGMLGYLNSKIENFESDFMNSLATSLDKAYDHDLDISIIKEKFENLISGKKTVALWGCGDVAEKIFKKYDFDFLDTAFYVVDKSKHKQENNFRGHKIFPPSVILEKGIDTVMTASARYSDEITREIKEKYPCVRYIVRLDGLSDVLEEEDIRKDCWLR